MRPRSSRQRQSFGALAVALGICVALVVPFAKATAPSGQPILSSPQGGPAEDTRPGHYIVVLRNSVEHPGSVAEAQSEKRDGDLGFVYRSAIKGYSVSDLTKADVKALRGDPRVKYVQPDRRVEALAQSTPNGIKRIGAAGNPTLDIDEVDDIRVNADVAIIDTGIDHTHPRPERHFAHRLHTRR